MREERIEAMAQLLYERDVMRGAEIVGFYSNLRPYYEADAKKILAVDSEIAATLARHLRLLVAWRKNDTMTMGWDLFDAAERALWEFDRVSKPEGK
jgi:hypothetical protein